MYIVDVIPLTLLPPQVPQILSYFFDRSLDKGAVVRVALNGRFISAVVIGTTSLENNRLLIKKSSFALRPIATVQSEKPLVSDRQLHIAQWIASHYYAPLGATLKTVLPPFFGKRGYRQCIDAATLEVKSPDKPAVLQTSAQEIATTIDALARRSLKNGHVLVLVPDIVIGESLMESLKAHKPELVHSGLSNKQLAAVWKLLQGDEPCLIIGTRSALFLPYSRLAAIIIEDPDHEFYKSDKAPRYDATVLAEKITSDYGARCIYVTRHISTRFSSFPERFSLQPQRSTTVPEVVDMGREIRAGNFSLFSRDIQELLKNADEAEESVLLFSSRKAYAALLVCKTCGYAVPCANCSTPMRVHHTPVSSPGGTAENMLVCYHCLAYQPLPKACPRCHNSQFLPGGHAGSQQIYDEYRQYVLTPAMPIIFDGDLIRTKEHEMDALEKIKRQSVPLVVATSLILHHRYRMRFNHVIVVDADALLSNPDFRTEERFLSLVQKLQDFGPKRLYCQTRNPEWPIFHLVSDGIAWSEKEVRARRDLRYPPFSRIAKLSFQHPQYEKTATEGRKLAETLTMVLNRLKLQDRVQILGPVPALIARENNRYTQNIVLKFDPDLKPSSILKFVPSPWLIDVDPRNIV